MTNELPDLYDLWDYNDPAATQAKFEEILPRAKSSSDKSYYLQLLTQIARTYGLQAEYSKAHDLLDKVEAALTEDQPLVSVRYLLERGRTYNSDRQRDKAQPLFISAYELSKEIGEMFYAVDAAHMVAIAVSDPAEKEHWNLIGVADAEQSDQPRTRKWLGSLYNNLGWDYFSQERFDEALAMFKKTLTFFVEDQPDEGRANIARWSVAKAYRMLGRFEGALEIQLRLQAEYEKASTPDGYVFEELAEIYLSQDNEAVARPLFAKAYAALSADVWLQRNESERLERLRRLGGVENHTT